jgi:ADP-ribosyl-[dinitrogen reductase] hydrolase
MPFEKSTQRTGAARTSRREDQFVGCLVGLAIGDALGMPFEGMSARAIQARHATVTEFLPGDGLAAGQYTDDTKMMLCIAESLAENGCVNPEDVARRFVAWFDSGDLRGIGVTCAEAILHLKRGVPWQESGRRGKWAAGNGTAMRIAPVGLADCLDLELLRQDCWATSVITHNNAEAFAGAAAVAFVVAGLVTGHLSLDTLLTETADFIGPGEVGHRLKEAQSLLAQDTLTPEALALLGTGGYVVETAASALYCFLRSPDDFLSTCSAAVVAGGDTDTTAAVAGAISGAYNGVGRLPAHLVAEVEDTRVLQELGQSIYRGVDSRIDA